jgi:hypothetical protein
MFSFIGQNIYDFAEYTESINGILAFYNLAFQREWKLGYDRCINICTSYGSKTGTLKFVGHFVAGGDAEEIGFFYVWDV